MATKADIIRESTLLFAENGFQATSIATISKAVNLSASAGGIYRHFKSKRDIFDAIFDSYYENFGSLFNDIEFKIQDSAEANKADVNKKDIVQGLIHMSLQQAKSNKNTLKLYFREHDRITPTHQKGAELVRNKSIKSFQSVCRYLTDGDSDFDSEAVAAILIDSINFRVCEFSPDFGISEERFIASLTDLLCALVICD